jgi:hypothetical protein
VPQGQWAEPQDQWTGPPAAPQEPPPAPRPGIDRRLVWSVVVGAAAVGVAVSLVLALVVDPGGKHGHAQDDRTRTASVSPSPTASRPSDAGTLADGGPPSSSPPAPPSGYHVQQDREGFRVAVPDGWSRTSVASQFGIRVVNYRSPDRTHRLQVYQVMEESPDASFELFLSPQTPKPAGFEKLSLENLDGAGFTGSRLEYLADRVRGEPDVGTWHVYDERFVAADGQIYALAAYGPDADGREDELKLLTTALAWFCPPGMSCNAAGQD